MTATALLAIGGGMLALGLHPFTSYPVSLAVAARTRVKGLTYRPTPPPHPRIALCVCAYNEAGIIRAKAENMLSMRRAVPGIQLLIYVDAASDGTAQVLREFEGNIRVVVGDERRGKTHGMNTLVGLADAEIVVFSDANVMFAADAVRNLLLPFEDPEVGCVCGQLVYRAAEGSATAATGSLYWRLEEFIKEMESRTGSTMGADGSIFAIRKSLHRPPPDDIIDDMYVSMSILCDGHRVVRSGSALAYEELVSRPGEEFRRKVRIACQAYNVHRFMRGSLRQLGAFDRYKYVSHKLIRWFSGYLLAGGGMFLLAGLAVSGQWLAASLMLVAGAAVLASARAWPGSLAGKLLDVAAAFAATGLGVWRSLRGDRFQTWQPPASARAVSSGTIHADAMVPAHVPETRRAA